MNVFYHIINTSTLELGVSIRKWCLMRCHRRCGEISVLNYIKISLKRSDIVLMKSLPLHSTVIQSYRLFCLRFICLLYCYMYVSMYTCMYVCIYVYVDVNCLYSRFPCSRTLMLRLQDCYVNVSSQLYIFVANTLYGKMILAKRYVIQYNVDMYSLFIF